MEAAGGQAATQGPVQRRQAQRVNRPRLPPGPFQDPELLAQLADIGTLSVFHLIFRE